LSSNFPEFGIDEGIGIARSVGQRNDGVRTEERLKSKVFEQKIPVSLPFKKMWLALIGLIGKMILLGPAHVGLRKHNQKETLPLCWIAC